MLPALNVRGQHMRVEVAAAVVLTDKIHFALLGIGIALRIERQPAVHIALCGR